MNYWSKKEDSVLREHYPIGGSLPCIELLPGRVPHAIRRRANRIGLVSSTGPAEAGRLSWVNRSSHAEEYNKFVKAVRPSHLPPGVQCGSDESNRLCNEAYLEALRREAVA